jgi:hypothetical protein
LDAKVGQPRRLAVALARQHCSAVCGKESSIHKKGSRGSATKKKAQGGVQKKRLKGECRVESANKTAPCN